MGELTMDKVGAFSQAKNAFVIWERVFAPSLSFKMMVSPR